jgi:hypothetical protein
MIEKNTKTVVFDLSSGTKTTKEYRCPKCGKTFKTDTHFYLIHIVKPIIINKVWVSLEEYNALSVEFASYKASLKKELDCYLEVVKRNNDKYFKNVKVADNKDRYMYWNATLKTLEYLYNSLCCGGLKRLSPTRPKA